jgi:hypothetical protein
MRWVRNLNLFCVRIKIVNNVAACGKANNGHGIMYAESLFWPNLWCLAKKFAVRREPRMGIEMVVFFFNIGWEKKFTNNMF